MNTDIFKLTILSREGNVFDGDVASITSFNDKGKFDVLAQHANFISLIKNSVIIIDLQGKKNEIQITNALMKVHQNNVKIYLGIEWFSDSNQKNSADIPS